MSSFNKDFLVYEIVERRSKCEIGKLVMNVYFGKDGRNYRNECKQSVCKK